MKLRLRATVVTEYEIDTEECGYPEGDPESAREHQEMVLQRQPHDAVALGKSKVTVKVVTRGKP